MQNGIERKPFTPGLIDIDILSKPMDGWADGGKALVGNHGKYYLIGFSAVTGERYNLEVDVNLVDEERGVMSVFVLKDYDDGNCLVLLPETSFMYNDRAVLPREKIYEWSPRLSR